MPDNISGFPTIKLYPAGKKDSPVDYSGARTVEDLAAFIKDNGSNMIDVSPGEAVDGKDADAGKSQEGKSETMQHQAPAATEKGKVEKAKDAAQKVVNAATGGDDQMDDHDEL